MKLGPDEYHPEPGNKWLVLLDMARRAFSLPDVHPWPLVCHGRRRRHLDPDYQWPSYQLKGGSHEGFVTQAGDLRIEAGPTALTISRAVDVRVQQPEKEFSWIDLRAVAEIFLPDVTEQEIEATSRQFAELKQRASWFVSEWQPHIARYRYCYRSPVEDPTQSWLRTTTRENSASFRTFLLFPSGRWSVQVSHGGPSSPLPGEFFVWRYMNNGIGRWNVRIPAPRRRWEFRPADEECAVTMVGQIDNQLDTAKLRMHRSLREQPCLAWPLRPQS